MVFNTTFNNISVILSRLVLLVEETRVPRENHRPAEGRWKLYHIMLYLAYPTWEGFELTTLVVIGTDCISSCKSNYHTITTTTVRTGICMTCLTYMYCIPILLLYNFQSNLCSCQYQNYHRSIKKKKSKMDAINYNNKNNKDRMVYCNYNLKDFTIQVCNIK